MAPCRILAMNLAEAPRAHAPLRPLGSTSTAHSSPSSISMVAGRLTGSSFSRRRLPA